MDMVEVLADQTPRTAEMVRTVRVDQFDLPTPCTGWDVRALLNHLCIVADFWARVAGGDTEGPRYETDFLGDDHAAAYDRASSAMLEACSDPALPERTVTLPIGEAPGAIAIGGSLMDTVVHRWDLAKALGIDHGIDEDTAAFVLEQSRVLMPDGMRAESAEATTETVPLGPQVDVGPDATAVERLVAYLGRTP